MSETQLLRRPEAAKYIGLSKQFLDRAACVGNGPPMVRLSAKAIGYRKCDLDSWIESRIVMSTSQKIN
ncbi:AlpA family transcriptional regulator [Acidocella sp.]|uniref:helix-turn-helix transcriptional regulator n=1 Tax=Acidocella sp. TaxID=50710 RepID=UPI00183D7ED0|nr:hypothetical protein [Acidocella sp.]NNM56301.1 AlpA family phage regulatory protein [Acidocella sp.]